MIKLLKLIGYVIIISALIFSTYVLYSRFILKNDIVNIFGYSYFKVRSNSMQPDFEAGDIIIIKLTTECKINDVITYKENDIYVTHKVIDINNDVIITKGENNNTEDKPITKNQVVGVVIKIIK